MRRITRSFISLGSNNRKFVHLVPCNFRFCTQNKESDSQIEFQTFTQEELVKMGKEKKELLEKIYQEQTPSLNDKLIAAFITFPVVISASAVWFLPEAWISKALTFSVKYLAIQLSLYSGMNFGYSIVEHQLSLFTGEDNTSRIKIYSTIFPVMISAFLIYQMVYAKEEKKLCEDDISLGIMGFMFVLNLLYDRQIVQRKMGPAWLQRMKAIQVAISLLSIGSLITYKNVNPSKWSLGGHLKSKNPLLSENELLQVGK